MSASSQFLLSVCAYILQGDAGRAAEHPVVRGGAPAEEPVSVAADRGQEPLHPPR